MGWLTGAQFLAGAGIFLFETASRQLLVPTLPPIQWLPKVLIQEVKRWGREADISPLVSRLRMCGALLLLSHMSSRRGAYLSTGTTLPITYVLCSKIIFCVVASRWGSAWIRCDIDTSRPIYGRSTVSSSVTRHRHELIFKMSYRT
jgi:hypothetical protein